MFFYFFTNLKLPNDRPIKQGQPIGSFSILTLDWPNHIS